MSSSPTSPTSPMGPPNPASNSSAASVDSYSTTSNVRKLASSGTKLTVTDVKPPSHASSPGVTTSLPPPNQRITLHVRHARPSLAPILTRLRYNLAPLYPLPFGPAHPSFPPSLFHYHLLTESELDSIATYYHQRPGPTSPSRIWTGGYPAQMNWDDEFLAHVGATKRGADEDEADAETEGGEDRMIRIKRRKVGRFIGLRGCHTPADEAEEYQKWKQAKESSRIKGDEIAFWGRRGWRA